MTSTESSNMPQDRYKLVGKILDGRYRILSEVGHGGMATVYQAQQQNIDRVVAIKVLPPQLMIDPGFLERFEREVSVVAALEHPHIVPIYDYGQADGLLYIAMRFLTHGTMREMIRGRTSEPESLERLIQQIGSALDHAHEYGIVHRDMKPGNILLDRAGNAYLSDFGIARMRDSELTGSGIIGTPGYMSPEQAHGITLDGRSDIYSLGVMLFEALAGRVPFSGNTPISILMKHVSEPMPSIRVLRPEISEFVEQVIFRATHKNPEERFATGRAMFLAYRAALAGRSIEMSENDTFSTKPDSLMGDATELIIPSDMLRNATPSGKSRPVAKADTPAQNARRDTPAQQLSDSQVMDAGLIVPMLDAGADGAASLAAAVSSTGSQPGLGVRPGTARRAGGLNRATLWGGLGFTALLVLVIGVGIFATSLNAPVDIPVPTPFPLAETVDTGDYTLSMLENWVGTQRRVNMPTGRRIRWVGYDGNLFIDLWSVNVDGVEAVFNTEARDTFAAGETALQQFDTDALQQADSPVRYFEVSFTTASPDDLQAHFIDAELAEDGTVRRSYRIVPVLADTDTAAATAPANDGTAGQLDVYYIRRAREIVVVALFSDDRIATDRTLVPTMREILNSIRLQNA